MKTEKMNFYLLKDSGLVARGSGYHYWLYYDFKWNKDTSSMVRDRLNGYDPSEPEGSPYGFGSTSIMDEIEQISYEEAMDIIGEQIVLNLLSKWAEDFKERKEEWDKDPGWPAKLTETSFFLFGTKYTLTAADLGFGNDSFDEGFVETIQKAMEKDLAAVGATEIESYGLLD